MHGAALREPRLLAGHRDPEVELGGRRLRREARKRATNGDRTAGPRALRRPTTPISVAQWIHHPCREECSGLIWQSSRGVAELGQR